MKRVFNSVLNIPPSSLSSTCTRSIHTSSFNFGKVDISSSSSSKFSDIFGVLINFSRRLFGSSRGNMSYVVLGVSGVTCGGKTSLTKLLQKKFPQAVIMHQDHYFYDDDWPGHIRCPEAEDHVNYEILSALDMEKMYKDVGAILKAPPKLMEPPKENGTKNMDGGQGDKAAIPNFDYNFLRQVPDIDYDVSKYEKVPILIIEGFTMFASQYLFDVCDARFFCTLDKATCKQRRALRTYTPPDTPNFFDKIVWPEYVKHYEEFIEKRPGITVFDGAIPIEEIWRRSVEIVACRIEEKLQNGDATLAKNKANPAL